MVTADSFRPGVRSRSASESDRRSAHATALVSESSEDEVPAMARTRTCASLSPGRLPEPLARLTEYAGPSIFPGGESERFEGWLRSGRWQRSATPRRPDARDSKCVPAGQQLPYMVTGAGL